MCRAVQSVVCFGVPSIRRPSNTASARRAIRKDLAE